MIKGEYDYLKDLASRNLCFVHRMPLVVAWYQEQWTLRCDGDGGHYPDALTRQLSLTEEYLAFSNIPEPIKSNIIKRQRRKAMTQDNELVTQSMGGVPATDLATGQSLTLADIKALIEYAQRYALDPYRGHVVVMYSKLYITIDGYLYHARQEQIPYSLSSRPLKGPERIEYKIGDNDHAWLATVTIIDPKQEFTGVGIISQEEMTAKSPRDQTKLRSPVVATHPWQLAQKRAEWQALRRAFPIGETKEVTHDDRDGN